MKRRFTITLLILALVVVLPLLLCFSLRPTPSEAFLRYRDNPHLNVAYLPDYPIDDTLRLDITTITATDSTGWNTLIDDFGFGELIKATSVPGPRRAFGMKVMPKIRIDKSCGSDTVDRDVAIVQYKERAVYMFHVKTIPQMRAIIHKSTVEISCSNID